jgi:hypothetical protein
MPQHSTLRGTFLAFHLVLGLALLWGSVHTVLHAGDDLHARAIGSVEAVGAVLFLIPRTLRPGAMILLVIILLAAALHAARGEWRPDLLVYAAGVALVAVHASVRPVPGAASAA